jgi:hypothetical protein
MVLKNTGRGSRAVDIPTEWGDAAKKEDIVHVHEKLEKCYSQERYSDFQEAVKKITLDVLGHDDGKAKIKPCAREATKEFFEEDSWRKAKLWIPVALSIAAVLVSIFKP